MEKKKLKKTKKVEFEEEIINYVKDEYERRREERFALEKQWELNLNFMAGKQYVSLNSRGEIIEEEKAFFWQKREVFNHVAPIVELRSAKMGKIKPVFRVKANNDDDKEIKNAQLAEKILNSTMKKIALKKTIEEATMWSETTGTAFYKVMWNENGGAKVGEQGGKPIYEGEVEVLSVSPFEIFPDVMTAENIESTKSIIQAKVMSVNDVFNLYGVKVKGEQEKVITVKKVNGVLESNDGVKENSVTVIEYYEKPTKDYPLGRLITVASDKLLYYGDLPYVNGFNGSRTYPFIRQLSLKSPGSFFGVSIIERLIPVQRAFNAVKNRKFEFINRLSSGVLTIEDGSVDTDELIEEGLCPGKVIVYRQGSNKPEIINENDIPTAFIEEEKRLIDEFVVISGVSDVSSSSKNASLSSAAALELLVEQDNERLTVSAEEIRESYRVIAEHILRLYKEFMIGAKIIDEVGEDFKRKIYYVDKSVLTCDQVSIANENELIYTENQKKNMFFKLYESGMLEDDNGKIRTETKEKLLTLLGYSDLAPQKGIIKLQREKAQYENKNVKNKFIDTEAVDDDNVHVEEHTIYLLSEYEYLSDIERKRLNEHISLHKQKLTSNTLTVKENY